MSDSFIRQFPKDPLRALLGYRRRPMSNETVWARVDYPVLRFIEELRYDMQWQFDRREPVEELPELTGEEVDAALRRLQGHGLIEWGTRTETVGFFHFARLRLCPDGLRLLGQWPPAERAQLGEAIVQILRVLGDDAKGEGESKALRRAAGAVGRFAGDVVFDTAKGELRDLGGQLGS